MISIATILLKICINNTLQNDEVQNQQRSKKRFRKNLGLHIQNWSIEQADSHFNLLMNEIEFIAENPASGKDCSQIRKGYFRSKVKSHFIFYKINSIQKVIEIIRILHQRMDIHTRLNE